MKSKNSLSFWFVFVSLLSATLVIQSAFLPNGEKYSLTPYLTWPPLLFFLLYHNNLSSLCLLFVMSLLSNVFFSLSVLSLFILYIFCFLIVVFVKLFFFSKSPLLFFILVFVISFCFPYFVDLSHDFSINDYSLSTSLFYFSKASATLVLSFLIFPFLKKYLQPRSDF